MNELIKYSNMHLTHPYFLFSSSTSIDLHKPEAMDSNSQDTSERILLEPYKYLLQLPGESFSVSVTTDWWTRHTDM